MTTQSPGFSISGYNKSRTVRAALESLATHIGYDGWVMTGYSPVQLLDSESCHCYGTTDDLEEVLYRSLFEMGKSREALPQILAEVWLNCHQCVEQRDIA